MVGRGRPLEPRTTVIDIEGTERFQDILVWYRVQPCDEAVCKVGLRAQHQNNQLRQKKQIGWEYGALVLGRAAFANARMRSSRRRLYPPLRPCPALRHQSASGLRRR